VASYYFFEGGVELSCFQNAAVRYIIVATFYFVALRLNWVAPGGTRFIERSSTLTFTIHQTGLHSWGFFLILLS